MFSPQTTSLPHLADAARNVIAAAGTERILLFYGEMGAGKTTLIKEICRELGVDDAVSSPTFSIVNEYRSPQGPIYHFDFYRLKTPTEALDLGYEDYLYSGQYCLIEWPEKIAGLLPEHYTKVELGHLTDDTRSLTVTNY